MLATRISKLHDSMSEDLIQEGRKYLAVQLFSGTGNLLLLENLLHLPTPTNTIPFSLRTLMQRWNASNKLNLSSAFHLDGQALGTLILDSPCHGTSEVGV